MARMQILELPEGSSDDRPPFVLVIDQYEPPPYPADVNDPGPFDGIAEKIGARAVLVFEEAVDIPANDMSGYVRDDTGLKVGQQEWVVKLDTPVAVRDANGDGLKVRDKDAELRAANEWIERLHAERDEARSWARHGYEIGQRHCGWTDHGVAPDWLTEGWPPHIDSCDHLKQAAAVEEAEAIRRRVAKEQKAALTDALGMDRLRDWDDIRNAATALRKQRDEQAEAIDRVRSTAIEPEIMNAQQEHPTVWMHGYACGVLAAKSALRPPTEAENQEQP